jgi:two-component system KDP operon response regulator KdpE
MNNHTNDHEKKLVLVVDDEPRILRFVSLSLSSLGFTVIKASTGEEGLQMVASERPDAMILDIFMPGLDGFDVLRRLRTSEDKEGRHHLPVIVFSARSSAAEQAFALGATDFISKPFLPEEIAEKLEAALDHRNGN